MNSWESNPKWKELLKPSIGDLVILKLTDVYQYHVKVIVTAIAQDEITGRIEAIFDWQTKGEVRGGEKTRLVDMVVSFGPHFVQDVIKSEAMNPQTKKPE